MDWIIILFFIYFTIFWVEKLEELTCMVILTTGPNLEIWVQKTVKSISDPNDLFLVQTLMWRKILNSTR
jgi:hypothetical protein